MAKRDASRCDDSVSLCCNHSGLRAGFRHDIGSENGADNSLINFRLVLCGGDRLPGHLSHSLLWFVYGERSGSTSLVDGSTVKVLAANGIGTLPRLIRVAFDGLCDACVAG